MSQSPDDASSSSHALNYRQGWKALNRLLHEDRAFSGDERNCAYLNLATPGAPAFADASAVTGFDFPDDARALAPVDWDFDGDLDLWVTNRTAPRLRLLANSSPTANNFLALHLHGDGKTTNRDAVGARVAIKLDDGSVLTRTVSAGDAFLSQASARLHFGLGGATSIKSATIHWPGAEQEIITGLKPGNFYEISQGKSSRWTPPEAELPPSPYNSPPPAAYHRIILPAPLAIPAEVPNTPTLLTIWSDTCPRCQAELPGWTEHAAAIKEAGLAVKLLYPDTPPPGTFPFPTSKVDPATLLALDLFQRSQLDRRLPLPTPTTFLVRPDSRAVAIYLGPVPLETILADAATVLTASPEKLRAAASPFSPLGLWSNDSPSPDPLPFCAQLVDHLQIDTATSYLERYAAEAQKLETPPAELADAFYVIGVLLAEQGERAGAIAALIKARELSPSDQRPAEDLANLYLSQNNPSEAVPHLGFLLEKNPETGSLHLALADALRDSGRSREAVAHYKNALRYSPKLLVAADHLARLLATSDDPEIRRPSEALALANRLVKITGSKNPTFLETLALAKSARTADGPTEKTE